MFEGVYTAIVTPFAESGAVDFKALAALVERQIAGGVDGVVPCGTTGESATLSDEERVDVFRATLEAAAGRVKVIAGVGTNDTRRSVEMARAAARLGADGGLVVAPYYNKPTQEGLYQHCRAVAESADLPLMLYNVPSRTAVAFSAETLARLSALPGVVAVKEATADLNFGSDVVAAVDGRLTVVSGDDPTALPLWAVGGRGVVSVTSNLLPAEMVSLWRAFAAGDLAGATAQHHRLLPMFRGLFLETNPSPVKTLVAWHTGLCRADTRLPLVPLLPATVERLRALCDRFELALPWAPTA